MKVNVRNSEHFMPDLIIEAENPTEVQLLKLFFNWQEIVAKLTGEPKITFALKGLNSGCLFGQQDYCALRFGWKHWHDEDDPPPINREPIPIELEEKPKP